ncbi:MAG: phosphoribosylformylglycinamidine synthase, partial [Oscillospiraceae bacterium]|nr:phosphoribosylformylglycinamidine synthase [Oscillospiraceae bacterium]
TEIEPFGGAATCIGGCIRDPLSGRAYVHQAMRVTGAGDPRKSLSETLAGKLPQRKLCQTAAAGYSSYGNQIGLATGHVAELYHEGFIAKRLECGAVVAAAPASNVRRERPAAGDVIILLGGRTGRDGIGGATGSSKSHNLKSLTTMASEVQKGNAPEERKIQRLFRNPEVTRLIKRCNDFGAGGVSVAIGELADGLRIDLDAVRKKYDGLDGTELAISESQERMAVVVEAKDVDAFIAHAEQENLEAYRVATVTEEARMVMTWKGKEIANLSREFLNTNGAVKHSSVSVADRKCTCGAVTEGSLRTIASELKFASQRGLVERFDASIGAGSVLMPFGGKNQSTPTQAMAAKLPVLPGQETDQASLFAWGCDPDLLSADPYTGAKASIISSVAKIVAAGADYKKAYLTLQEFFEKLKNEPARWGKPFQALLGALDAQLGLNAAAIGGKDSMSGTFLDKDVPPTLISFAIAPLKTTEVISNEFKEAGHPVYLFKAGCMSDFDSLKAVWEQFHALCLAGKVKAAWAVEGGGIAEAVMKMSFGNSIGFKGAPEAALNYGPAYGQIIAELAEEIDGAELIGWTSAEETVTYGAESISIAELYELNTAVLENVYPTQTVETKEAIPAFSTAGTVQLAPAVKVAKPKVLIPVFPGTNCEFDSARAVMAAGAEAEIAVIRNLTADDVARSVESIAAKIADSQMIFIPGGFSGGDEPDGSAKFITAFFRNPAIKEQVEKLLNDRDGLMCGICNGFQALVKLGLVPYGKIIDTDANCPTLTFNTIARHQSRIVQTRIASTKSPWLSLMNVGDIVNVPISHGEGKFLAPDALIQELAANGQIATQYVDLNGNPTMDAAFNPNGSLYAIEGITSPDGRVIGKMGHSERFSNGCYKNVPGNYDIQMFKAAVKYFK